MYMALLRPNSLTASGKSINGSPARLNYRSNYLKWHKRYKNLYIPFPLMKRPFQVSHYLL